MSTYWDTVRSSSNCLHFIYSDHPSDLDESILLAFEEFSIKIVYIDVGAADKSKLHVIDAIAILLDLPNAPYFSRKGPVDPRVPFLDDLITLSKQGSGIVIILDNAASLFFEHTRTLAELIEAFLIPLHHWLDRKKAYHLCFQMNDDSRVREIFSRRPYS